MAEVAKAASEAVWAVAGWAEVDGVAAAEKAA